MKNNIFENPTKEMPAVEDRPARSSQDFSDTWMKAKPPGMVKVPGREVENIRRPRRGHGY